MQCVVTCATAMYL